MTTETIIVTDTPADTGTAENAETQAATEVAAAAVEIAEIEAARDVEIAEIQAETVVEITEASIEAETARVETRNLEGEIDECRLTIETLRQTQTEQTELLQSILSRLTPAETNLSSLPENVSPEATQASPEVHAEPAKEKPKKKSTRWI